MVYEKSVQWTVSLRLCASDFKLDSGDAYQDCHSVDSVKSVGPILLAFIAALAALKEMDFFCPHNCLLRLCPVLMFLPLILPCLTIYNRLAFTILKLIKRREYHM